MLRSVLCCSAVLLNASLHAQQLTGRRDIAERVEEYGSMAFSPDGKLLYSAGTGDVIKVRDVATGELLSEFSEHERCYTWALAISPNGKTLAAAHGYSGDDRVMVRLFDATTGELQKTLQGHERVVRSIAFSSDSSTMWTCGDDQTLRRWDATTGEEVAKLPSGGASFDYDPQSGRLAVPAGKQGVEIWDVEIKQQSSVLHTDSVASTVAISPGGQFIATGGPDWRDSSIQIWNVESGEHVATCSAGREDRVSRMAFSPDGKLLASAELNGSVALWNPKTGEQLSHDHGGCTSGLEFSPNGKWLAQVYGISDSGSGVMLWEVAGQ